MIYLTLERVRPPFPLSFNCCILFSLPLLSAWHDSHCIGGCSYGEHGVRKPRDIVTSGQLLGRGPKPLFTPPHLQTSASPPLAFPPILERSSLQVRHWIKAWSLPALSAQGLAHYIHTERALSDVTSAAHAGSPARPGPFGREAENWSCSEPCPACTPLPWRGQRARWLVTHRERALLRSFLPLAGAAAPLSHMEPTQGTDSCTRLVLSHSRPHTLPWLPGLRQNSSPCTPRPPAAFPESCLLLYSSYQFLHMSLCYLACLNLLFIYRQALLQLVFKMC